MTYSDFIQVVKRESLPRSYALWPGIDKQIEKHHVMTRKANVN